MSSNQFSVLIRDEPIHLREHLDVNRILHLAGHLPLEFSLSGYAIYPTTENGSAVVNTQLPYGSC
jgi:hypothetical protein